MFDRTFGIEIEAFNVDQNQVVIALRDAGLQCQQENYNHRTQSYWKVVRDGSIQGDQAFELVSPILQGEEGLRQVKIVMHTLTRIGAKVNKSCGFHVHFGAKDLTVKQLKAILTRWISYEDVIDLWMPESRRGNVNHYCNSVWAGYESKEHAIQKLKSYRKISTIASLWAKSNRYKKLNIQSYARHGTIEFRHHGGTHDAVKSINWIKFLAQFIQDALDNRPIVQGSVQARFDSLFAGFNALASNRANQTNNTGYLRSVSASSFVNSNTTILKKEVARRLGVDASEVLKTAKRIAKQNNLTGDFRKRDIWLAVLELVCASGSQPVSARGTTNKLARYYENRAIRFATRLNSASSVPLAA